MLATTGDLRAQISLPSVPLPNLPRVDTPVDLDRTLNRATDTLDLRELRLNRVRNLIRTHRDVIEADPRGAPILRSEVLAFSPSEQAVERARAAGFAVIREKTLDGLDARIVVLRAPEGMSTRRALKRLRAGDPAGIYDFNHIYTESGAVFTPANESPPTPVAASAQSSPSAGAQSSPSPGAQTLPVSSGRVGLIDGGIDAAHPVFRNSQLQLYGCEGRRVPSTHGTAVASLIVGQAEGFHGAAANTRLYAADVYCGVPTGGAVDVVVDALAWMAREQVPVVNISLVGPPNAMLENVTRAILARGHLLVAAVGNDGPAARPLYPAAYAGVIGVTGVDARQRALVEACRGPHVDLAAPGADMAAASLSARYAAVRGTSFAAPIVAGLLASQLPVPDGAAAATAVRDLSASAIDLGARGRDQTYGEGLVGATLRVAPSLAGASPLSQKDK